MSSAGCLETSKKRCALLLVRCRALQAAKLRATKPALERHNVHVHGHGSELLVFSHAFGYNRSVSRF